MVTPPQPVTRPDDWVLVLSAHEMVRRLARREVRRWSPDLDGLEGDLEHVGLLVLHRLAPRYDPERCPQFARYARPWVGTAMWRFARRHVRALGDREPLAGDASAFMPDTEGAVSVHDLPIDAEERAVLELRLQGYSEAASAERLGVCRKVVRIRLRRLRERLQDLGGGG